MILAKGVIGLAAMFAAGSSPPSSARPVDPKTGLERFAGCGQASEATQAMLSNSPAKWSARLSREQAVFVFSSGFDVEENNDSADETIQRNTIYAYSRRGGKWQGRKILVPGIVEAGFLDKRGNVFVFSEEGQEGSLGSIKSIHFDGSNVYQGYCADLSVLDPAKREKGRYLTYKALGRDNKGRLVLEIAVAADTTSKISLYQFTSNDGGLSWRAPVSISKPVRLNHIYRLRTSSLDATKWVADETLEADLKNTLTYTRQPD